MKKNTIFVAGHNGFVGRAIVRRLNFFGYYDIITASKEELDLKNQKKVFNFIKKKKPNSIIVAAAKTGGIFFNLKNQSQILYDNLCIQNNLIEGARQNNVKNLIFLASSSIYPTYAKQPLKESSLLSGFLEKSHEPFSIAKISGAKLCQYYNIQYKANFKTLVLPNIYGPEDNYDLSKSSFFPALIKKIYLLKIKNLTTLQLFGNSNTKRELIYVDDVADACIYFLNKRIKNNILNIGSNFELTIKDYAIFIAKKLNIKIKIKFTKSSYKGVKRKILNSKIAIKYGWKPKVDLENGFIKTFTNFLEKNKKDKY